MLSPINVEVLEIIPQKTPSAPPIPDILYSNNSPSISNVLYLRENVTNVTLDMFMSDYRIGGTYLFIKVLEPEDSQKFIDCLFTYDQEVIDEVYKHRGMRFKLFQEILNQIKLSTNYDIWKIHDGIVDVKFGCYRYYSKEENMSCLKLCCICCCCWLDSTVHLAVDLENHEMCRLRRCPIED